MENTVLIEQTAKNIKLAEALEPRRGHEKNNGWMPGKE